MDSGAGLRLLNRWQRGFPLEPRPYARIAEAEGLDEVAVIEHLRALVETGRMARVGVLFRPNTVGASTLAAMCVPDADLERVAARVSADPGVNHNYERSHAVNLWFVATAADDASLDAALHAIERDTGHAVLRLPLLEEYHIDLGFDLEGRAARQRDGGPRPGRVEPGPAGRRLVAALGEGVPLVPRPWQALGEAAGMDESAVLRMLAAWLEAGVVRRIGAVARHRALGYRANAMVVWDVADDAVAAAGARLAQLDWVTLCYRRARKPPLWPYNLYCMIHGRDESVVRTQAERAVAAAGLEGCAWRILFSLRCFTQRGARYASAA